MFFNPISFAVNQLIAARQGLSVQESTRLGLVGAFIPGGIVTGAVITQVIAQREAPAPTTAVSTTPGGPPSLPPGTVQVQVPAVTGSSFDQARAVLQSVGLQAQRVNVLSTAVAKDIVISEIPTAGTAVAQNSVVTLAVSLGIIVPDVTNQPFPAAQAQLQALGFLVQRADQRSTTVAKDSVISQDPPAGQTLSAGGAVTLTVSAGANVIVPNVVEGAFEDARKQLQDLGLQVQRVDQNSDGINSGYVISQNPAAGSSVLIGSAVTLTVSTGQQFALPNVVGMSFNDAEALLKAKVLKVQRVNQASQAVRPDHVISQDPAANSMVAPGDTVTLLVSQGAAQADLPNLIGKPFNEARELLQDLDFKILPPKEVNSDYRKGTVADQDPKSGPVPPETEVQLYVSNGKPPLT